MNTEQKAKAYDEAKKWMESVYPSLTHEQQMEAESFFPELKENEAEKIRMALIHLVKKSKEQGGYALHKDEAERMLAWLEKQGETFTKKDIDDAYLKGVSDAKNELEKQGEQKVIVPKFRVGDKVRLKGSCGWYNVTEIRGTEYYLTSNDVVPCLLPICKQDDWEVEQKPVEEITPTKWTDEEEGYIR